MSANGRTLLGRNAGLDSRQAIYESVDGLEVESVERYEMTRRCVLFEDVVLVTYHRETGVAFIAIHGLAFLLFFLIGGVIYGSNGSIPAALIVAALGLPSLVLILIRLAMKVDVVTVLGRRSKAAIRFPYRKRLARETYGHVCARTRQVQEQIASENARLDAAPAEETPPAPPPAPILTTLNLP